MAVKQKVVEGQRGGAATAVAPQSPEGRLQLIVRALRDAAAREPADGTKAALCASVVLRMGSIYAPNDHVAFMRFMDGIKAVQEILSKECNNQELVLVTLKALYDAISDPNKTLSPAMSIVLQLMDAEAIPSAVKYILSNGHPEIKLRKALHTLCSWLTRWTYTPNLGPLVLEFMKGLEKERRFDLLLDVTVETVQALFKLLILPSARQSVGPVVLHMMARAQHSQQVLEKIAPHAKQVADILAHGQSPYHEPVVEACCALGGERMRAALGPRRPAASAAPAGAPPPGPLWLRADGGEPAPAALAPARPVGLANLGNTCYMNAALQALYASAPFREQVLARPGPQAAPLGALQVLFALLRPGARVEVAPADVLAALRPAGFAPGRQHDGSEFLECLLDGLDEQERADGAGADAGTMAGGGATATIVERWFGGRVTTVSTCASCGASSERVDRFRSLQLSFPPAGEPEPAETDGSSVQGLLDYFERPERLCDDNRYRCDGCGRLSDGERTARVTEAPPRLILTLKQFRYDPSVGGRAKLRRRVRVEPSVAVCGQRYALYAAVVHCGASADAGHYYALAEHRLPGAAAPSWYRLDDGAVGAVPADPAARLAPPHAPYVLLYARVGAGAGAEPEAEGGAALPQHLREVLRRRRDA